METIRIIIKGRELETSIPSALESGELLVPIKEIAHALGVIGSCQGDSLKLMGSDEIILPFDQDYAQVGSRRQQLPVAMRLQEGKLLAPIEAIAPWLGARVLWERAAKTLFLVTKEQAFVEQKIVLDPGHGGSDFGVRGQTLVEKDFTLSVAKRLEALLALAGARVALTRTRDQLVSAGRRAQIATDADLFLSLHCNYFYEQEQGGIESYYFHSWQGQRLAMALQSELAQELKLKPGVREASFELLQTIKAPAALVKLFYLSNPQEESQAQDYWFRQRMILALFRGIKGFFQ